MELTLLFLGWVAGLATWPMTLSVKGLVEAKRRNRRHQILLDAGVDPLHIFLTDV
jgi:hypothetical protein